MEYRKLIASRKNYFSFTEKVVDKQIILDVFEEVYYHAPSQNLLFPYEVTLYRNNNDGIKKELLDITHRNSNLSIEDDPGNPQVLAPWLIGLTHIDKHNTNSNSNDRKQRDLEIGILLTYISLGLKDRGVDTSFCKCIRDNARLGEIFGTNTVDVIIAVGYGNNKKHWIDLRTGKEKSMPYDINIVHKSRFNKKNQGLFKEVFKV